MPAEVREITTALYKKYYPMEQDVSIPREEKLVHLDNWWRSDMTAFTKAGFTRRDFAKMTEESELLMRHGTKQLFRTCIGASVPVLIVSGGIHEIVEHSLRLLEAQDAAACDDFSRVRILSNQFKYDAAGRVDGYQTPLIHSGNKDRILYDEASDARLRRNIIVMGDIIEDAHMVRDSEHGSILRVGILNDEVADQVKLDSFK